MVLLGFETILEADMRKRGFGSQRYLATGKERPHISKSKVMADDAAEVVALSETKQIPYDDWKGRRYIAFENVSYDLVVTLYNVNSPRAYAIRVFDTKDLPKKVKAGIKSVMTDMPNLEARIFGLQNKETHSFLEDVVNILLKEGIRLIEADLFGEETRHVAIDLKTGASYNLLLEDRIYRPGELINRFTVDDFSRTLIKPAKT